MVKFSRKGFKPYRRYFHDRSSADTDAAEFNKKLFREGSEGVHIGPRERRELQNLLLILKDRGLTINQAAEFIEKNTRKRSSLTWKDAVFSLLEARERQGVSERTSQNLTSRLKNFAEHSGIKLIDDVGAQDLQEYIYRPCSVRNQINDYAAFSNLFNFLLKRGQIEQSPLARVERPRDTAKKRPAIMKADDAAVFMERIAKHRDGLFVPYFALSLFAGLRPSEIADLDREDIRQKTIRVDGGKMKGRARRNVPLLPNLAKWLNSFSGSLCPHRLDSPVFVEARRLCPVTWKEDVCRHSFISYRMAIVEDERQVSREAGNSPDMIYAAYFELVSSAEAKAYFAISP
ncbi:tyrosine-type recombinase/integrase [Cerasicoccus arenae]|uniref:Core-binding (CB) domain-containing protein n=2 Tax=Cerasicoccus arenae TaxID=424488 RepID=A0A8J3DMT6_9BACT|nr:tyrosine-type recombinase/integrase [Cerasicoccus arenae]MBK1860017.1 tyrosine-type recombinase/integrase [Cerasicoccus arenae]GHC12618.1 hypothetical protein GCM10007047_32490 [Cerasicoccus arenae]